MGSSSTSPNPSSERSSSGFRSLPNIYAVFGPRFIFTTLSPKEVALGPYAHPSTGKPMHLFNFDDELVYTPFKNDHGPLNLAYTFDACVRIYDKLNSKELKRRAICLHTSSCPRQKSNLALISALYSLIVNHNDPWDAFQPISHFELLPFRDAGNGVNEYGLTVQDVLYGVYKAGQHGLMKLQEFDTDDYRYYERVENGDLNVLGDFLPFASPIDPAWIKKNIPDGQKTANYSPAQCVMLQTAFDKVMAKFANENVGLVVRLNEELYDRDRFVQSGMQHVDMYFDDGTNPTDEIVRNFIRLASECIQRGKRVAVHCKAGLGRTGVLIGAYLIYKYHFSASEVIGYMRLVRPGMVVGPQQRYMQLNQMKWAGWAATDAHAVKPPTYLPSPPLHSDATLAPACHPPEVTETQRESHIKAGDAQGQPRKLPIFSAVTPEPDETMDDSTPMRKSRSASSEAKDTSVRGTKRGSGRSPVPPTITAEPFPVRSVDIAQPKLNRTVSNASCSSNASELDQRATKRRNGEPPFSKSGLSSPPPSRDTTPADELPTISFPIEEAEEPVSPPPASQQLECAPSPSAQESTRQRSLLPRRTAIPAFKDVPISRADQLPSSREGSLSDSELTSSAASASSSIYSTRSRLRRPLVSTPRMWSTLTRMGGAALGQ